MCVCTSSIISTGCEYTSGLKSACTWPGSAGLGELAAFMTFLVPLPRCRLWRRPHLLCRTIHAVRQVNPEVTEHLAKAMSSLAQAVGALLSAPMPPSSSGEEVERIPLDDEWPEDP